MTTSMDIAVILDCSSSNGSNLNQIRLNILSILYNAVRCHQSDVNMALIESRSHTDYQVTNIYPFTSSIDTFQVWIDAVELGGGNSDNSKAIVDAIDASLSLDWRPNDNANRYHEKLVILITDGPPCNLLNDECQCNSKDLWTLTDAYEKQDITLVVVGVEPSVVVCDDFYYALASKTGGEYLPLINASRVLSFVIQQAILEEDTLSQMFRHLDVQRDIENNSLYHYSYVQKRARFMIEHCRTMSDIRRWLFPSRHRSINRINDDDNIEAHSPPWNGIYRNYLLGITSTPIPDDEGYRTRLPTTASADSSYLLINGSPVLSCRMDWDSTSENDDECFQK